MIEETLAKIEAAIREARIANKSELIALLEKLKTDIQREKRSKDVLDEAGEELEVAVVEFGATHPKLAAVVGEVRTLLASIGL